MEILNAVRLSSKINFKEITQLITVIFHKFDEESMFVLFKH